MDSYRISIERIVAHPDGNDRCVPQFEMNVKLVDRALTKIIAAIANELNYIAELSDE
jgi:hypothetical protein